MGSVLTPVFTGIENAPDLPQAATLCGACSVVCPVKIPLPELLRSLRERQVKQGVRPWTERASLRFWTWLALHPKVYALAARIAVRCLLLLADKAGMIKRLPFSSGWTTAKNGGRFMPAPQGKTFRELLQAQSKT